MKTLTLFNNKGGVGKTSLVYHLGFMFAELGRRVVFADLDPQANLSAMCLPEERLEEIWEPNQRSTIYGAIAQLRRGLGDVEAIAAEEIASNIALVVGDLQLSELEDELSQQWPKCLDRDERAFRVTTAFSRVVSDVAAKFKADIAVLDVGPNLGAINRAALIASDAVVVPLAPDLFSMQGLQNVGPQLKAWRESWTDRKNRAPSLNFSLPKGTMQPLGYVVGRHSVMAGGPVKAFQRWIDRMPSAYRESFGEPALNDGMDVISDKFCVGQLKDYRSLISMAQEAKKPMFHLKPADGAIGSHQRAVRQAYADFEGLAKQVLHRMNSLPD